MKKLATILSLALVIALSAGMASAADLEAFGIVELNATSVELDNLIEYNNPMSDRSPVLDSEWEETARRGTELNENILARDEGTVEAMYFG